MIRPVKNLIKYALYVSIAGCNHQCEGTTLVFKDTPSSSPSPSSRPFASPNPPTPPVASTESEGGVCYTTESTYNEASRLHSQKTKEYIKFVEEFTTWLANNKTGSKEEVDEYNRRLKIKEELEATLKRTKAKYCNVTSSPNLLLSLLPKQKGKTLPNTLLQGSLTSSRQRKA